MKNLLRGGPIPLFQGPGQPLPLLLDTVFQNPILGALLLSILLRAPWLDLHCLRPCIQGSSAFRLAGPGLC